MKKNLPKKLFGFGKISKKKIEDIRFLPADHRVTFDSSAECTWEEFLEETKGLPKHINVPPEPDHRRIYDEEFPILKKLFVSFENFLKENTEKWRKEARFAEENNLQREAIKQKYPPSTFDVEFNSYKHKKAFSDCVKRWGITYKTDQEVNDLVKQGYVTQYENVLYTNLSKSLHVLRQAGIKGHHVDLLIFSPKAKTVFAIEVDGGIHKRENVSIRDIRKEDALRAAGISLIRVSNNYIGSNLAKATEDILEYTSK